MAAITAERLLGAWESTLHEPVARRGAALLSGCRDVDPDAGAVAGWPLARRDAALFDLRCELFGGRATGLMECPACAEQLEIGLDLLALRPGTGDAAGSLTCRGYQIEVRAPSSDDLTDDMAAVAVATGEPAAVAALLDRCVVSVVGPDGESVPFGGVPAGVVEEVRAQVSKLVDDADVRLTLSCSGCGAMSVAPFDIAAFLLREVQVWAARVLREVHVLASAYGWDEPAILRLSPRRRRAYIELVEAAP